MLHLPSLSSFRTSKGYSVYLCCTCSLCSPSCVCICIHVTCAHQYIYICAYAHRYMSFVCTMSHNTMWVCVLCIFMICVYTYKDLCTCIHTHVHVCCCGLAMQKNEMLEFPSPQKPDSLSYRLLLHKLGKSKPSGFIRKKWIFSLTLYLLFLPPWSTISADVSIHWWIIILRKAVMWGCLIEVTWEGVIFFNCLRIIDLKIHSYGFGVNLIMLTRFIYGDDCISCIAELTHNKKVGLAGLRLRIARILAACVVPQGSAAVCPALW